MTVPAPRKWTGAALTAVGVILLLYLVRRIGLDALGANLSLFGPWLLLTCAIATCWLFLQAGAWWMIQDAFFERVALLELFRIKIISDAFNLILPSASMGGDAMRAFMIKERVPLRDGIPAVLFDKTMEFVASIVFLTSAFLLALVSLRLPGTLVVPAVVSLAVTTAGITLLVVVQKRGVTGSLLRFGVLIPGARNWIEEREGQFLAMDQNLRFLYTRSNYRAIPPLAVHIIARFVGVIEVLVILAVLNAPVSYVQALFICAVVTVGNTIFFLLPGQWGVMESVHILVLQSLGYPAAIGLSLSIIRRIRRILFVGVALVLFASGKRTSP